jgi:hypothetical protein
MTTEIPATTLVCVDSQYPALALRALRQTLVQCRYPAVKLLTDAAGAELQDARIERVAIERIASAKNYSRFMLKDLLRHVDTDFVQVVQWDGYVVNGAAWRSEFQEYDYIGARWWFAKPGRDVGNGGFSLRSRRLLEALQDAEVTTGMVEDHAICVTHREMLESRYGIRVAPGPLAQHYAFEGESPNPESFGFHGLFNLPLFCKAAELAEVFAQIPGDAYRRKSFATPMVNLIKYLGRLGRTQEALDYAQRLRGEGGYEVLEDAWRKDFDGAVERLSRATAP